MMPNRSHAANNIEKNPVFQIALLSGLDSATVCLAEQIKAPEDRQRLVNCAGIIAGTLLPLEYKADRIVAYSTRFIGANAGEIYNLCRAIKQHKFKNHIRSLSKRDVAAFVVKNLLVAAPVSENRPLTFKVADLVIDKIKSQRIANQMQRDKREATEPLDATTEQISDNICPLEFQLLPLMSSNEYLVDIQSNPDTYSIQNVKGSNPKRLLVTQELHMVLNDGIDLKDRGAVKRVISYCCSAQSSIKIRKISGGSEFYVILDDKRPVSLLDIAEGKIQAAS
jgi:hypothetical protein